MSTDRQEAVYRVITRLQHNPQETLLLRELADIAIMSPWHLDRVFRGIVGVPPRRYLSALRVNAAKRLLLTTPLSVLDVCFEVGYSSLGSFSSLFTQTVGLSPTKFRKIPERGYEEDLRTQILQPLLSRAQQKADPTSKPGAYGTVSAPDGLNATIFVGLFATPIPEGPPLACRVLQGPGDFVIHLTTSQEVYPFAAALDWSRGWEALLLYDSVLQARPETGQSLKISKEGLVGPVELKLVPPNDFDPPILVAIPELIRHWHASGGALLHR